MNYVELGTDGIKVSKLCYGTIPLGIGSVMDEQTAVKLLQYAFSLGVTFLDTAEIYNTQNIVGKAIEGRTDIVVATKSYAYTYNGMEASLKRALTEVGRDYIDVFLLHEQESEHTLRGHESALKRLVDAKHQGDIRAIGVSTHHVAGVRAAIAYEDIDIVHAIINERGVGIRDGSLQDMQSALKAASEQGKGIYAMKALGGGHLLSSAQKSLQYVCNLNYVHSVAVGMASEPEICMNTRVVCNKRVETTLANRCYQRRRQVMIESHCSGCGSCKDACHQSALFVSGRRVHCNEDNCILCGYCVAHCPEMAIKLI